VPKKLKLNHTTFIIAEVVLFYIVARWGRGLLDAFLLPYNLTPALLLNLRIVFVLLIVVVAYIVDRALFRFFTARGWLE
jgi:hypothetical protein